MTSSKTKRIESPTLAQLSEEIGKDYKRFRDHWPCNGKGCEFEHLQPYHSDLEFWHLALKKIARATYDAVKVEERMSKQLMEKNSNYVTDGVHDAGWNAAKAEQDRNFTSFMGEK